MSDNGEQRLCAIALFSFNIIAAASIILGIADLLAGVASYVLGCVVAISFTFGWAGFIPSVINGIVTWATNKRYTGEKWLAGAVFVAWLALVFHATDLIACIVALCMYLTKSLAYKSSTFVFTGGPETTNYYYDYYVPSPSIPEAARLVIVALLLMVDKYVASGYRPNVAREVISTNEARGSGVRQYDAFRNCCNSEL
jgi:hypothetical protein